MIGAQAIVVGAGIAGLATGRAVASSFERVVVVERDALRAEALPRRGTPQDRHLHTLLGGGQRALESVFPGFERALIEAGSVRMRAGLDVRLERPGFDPFPRRDLGWPVYSQSRADVEAILRADLARCGNVVLRAQCRAEELLVDRGGWRVIGIHCVDANGGRVALHADLVIECSGHGQLTRRLLQRLGAARPAETRIGVDVAYATAIFAMPDDAPTDWKGVFTLPEGPSTRAGLLVPLPGRRWCVSLGGRHGDRPPHEVAGYMAFARSLRTPTVSNALRGTKLLVDPQPFMFRDSVWRHYERLESFPAGLLLLGDAMCQLNPTHGQGMSIAALQAQALRAILGARAGERNPLDDLARCFFTEAAAIIETAWAQTVAPDFAHPETRGERPRDLGDVLRFGRALMILAARDAAVHKLMAEVQHLLRPRTAYADPELLQRVHAVSAES